VGETSTLAWNSLARVDLLVTLEHARHGWLAHAVTLHGLGQPQPSHPCSIAHTSHRRCGYTVPWNVHQRQAYKNEPLHALCAKSLILVPGAALTENQRSCCSVAVTINSAKQKKVLYKGPGQQIKHDDETTAPTLPGQGGPGQNLCSAMAAHNYPHALW
jgi:hypothetical protein